MAEAKLHPRPEYDYDVREHDIQRRFKHYDYPANEDLIPDIGSTLGESGVQDWNLVSLQSKPDPKSIEGRRRLLVLVYERTEYVS